MNASQFIEKHSFYPLHKTHIKTGKQFKFLDKGLVSYEETKSCFVVAGDPVCKFKKDIPFVLDQFVQWAHEQGKTVCGYYFSQFAAEGVTRLKSYPAGITLGTNLSDFELAGKKSKEIRRALNFGKKNNLVFQELYNDDYFELFFELKNLESKWFANKSTFKKIKFLLSPLRADQNKISDRSFVVKSKKNKIIAFVSLDEFKEPGQQSSFYVDHMFQSPSSYRLALDYLISEIILTLKAEKRVYLDLGFCPFQGVRPLNFIQSGLFLTKYMSYIYNSKGVYSYKKKFSNYTKSSYMLMDPKASKAKQILSLSQVTFS